jgi:hypothetical protein
MCKLKSGIILKDRVFVPEYDSHSDMLKELGIEDDYLGASKKFVRVELSPKDGDVFTDIDTWEYNVDQDILPDWYDEAEAKPRMIEAVKEWAKGHVHLGKDKLTIDLGCGHYIKDCTNVVICGNAKVSNICGNAKVSSIYGNAKVSSIYENATVSSIYENATVSSIYGNAKVSSIYGNATVSYIYGNATVSNIYGNATVSSIYGNATVSNICGNAVICSSPYVVWDNAKELIIMDRATFKDNYSKVIYQSGDFKFVSLDSGSKIGGEK